MELSGWQERRLLSDFFAFFKPLFWEWPHFPKVSRERAHSSSDPRWVQYMYFNDFPPIFIFLRAGGRKRAIYFCVVKDQKNTKKSLSQCFYMPGGAYFSSNFVHFFLFVFLCARLRMSSESLLIRDQLCSARRTEKMSVYIFYHFFREIYSPKAHTNIPDVFFLFRQAILLWAPAVFSPSGYCMSA